MATPSPRKLHKRNAPSRAGSDLSFSTQYSSTSTLVYEEHFSTSQSPTACKPWAVKALNNLGLKYKRSGVFGKGKKKEAEDVDSVAKSDDCEPHVSPFTRTPPPFVLDIRRQPGSEPGEEIDLLPDCLPQMVRRSPSSNALLQPGATNSRQLKDMRLASTPDLRMRSKRDSLEDPFYLETMINEFPRPPVHNPGDYVRRTPINPRVRRQNSNFSHPTFRAYPERAKMQAKYWIDRPVPKDILHSKEPPSVGKSSPENSDACN